ncbi:MAG: hypothetical protein IJO91_10070 [Oscillospiraceae bacterium]|nr:hypothetical protein [Oscillospiraceae bacterium]
MLLNGSRRSDEAYPDKDMVRLPLDMDEEIPAGIRAMMTFTNRFYGSM